MHNMADADSRLQEERRRQVDMVNIKREQKRKQVTEGGKTPRLTPAPAAAKKK
jgi:hypothetical protein